MIFVLRSIVRRSGGRPRKPAAVRHLRLERLEDRRLLIVNGVATSGWPAVVNVGGASGVLISPTSVLTAAHCAANAVTVGGKVYTAAAFIRHPAYNPNALGTDRGNDIAVIRLSQPVTGVAPIPILRSRPFVGQPATLVGFGLGGTDAGTVAGSGGVKRAGETRIDGVSTTILVFAFRTRGEATTASGDSGGPAVVQVGGVNYVAGIASGGTSKRSALGDVAFETRVDAYASWIDSVSRAPPPVPAPAPAPAPAPVPAPAPAMAGITVTPTTGLVTTEAGGRATFTVRLNSRPTANVTLGVSSSDTTEGTVSTPTLVFTPANWNMPQTVTVTGVDDRLVDGRVSYTVVTAAAVSSDAAYNRLNPADVSLTNLDNDVRTAFPYVYSTVFATGAASPSPIDTGVSGLGRNRRPSTRSPS